MSADPVLMISEVSKIYKASRGLPPVVAVDQVSLEVKRGSTFGLVGESGSGKSTLGRLILALEPPTHGRIVVGDIDFASLSAGARRRARRLCQCVFQDPFAALNRRRTIGQIVEFPLRVHRTHSSRQERQQAVLAALELVGLSPRHMNRYPHELSGGQCQRVGIARAIILQPDLIVLDEAVSALDASMRAQILNLLRELQARLGLTYIFISHDVSVVRYIADDIGVMYHGSIVEAAGRDELFGSPLHPYTRELIAAIPQMGQTRRLSDDRAGRQRDDESAAAIEGCRFRLRCPIGKELEICRTVRPEDQEAGTGHSVACHFATDAKAPPRTTDPPSTKYGDAALSGRGRE